MAKEKPEKLTGAERAESKKHAGKIQREWRKAGYSAAGVVVNGIRHTPLPFAELDKVPQHGDVLVPQGWKVSYVAEGVVWFQGRPNPIPLGDLEPVPGEDNTWRLVGVSSTEGL